MVRERDRYVKTTMVAGVIYHLLRIVVLSLLILLLLRAVAFYPLLVLIMVKILLEGRILWVIECGCGADHGRCRDIRKLAGFINVHLG